METEDASYMEHHKQCHSVMIAISKPTMIFMIFNKLWTSYVYCELYSGKHEECPLSLRLSSMRTGGNK